MNELPFILTTAEIRTPLKQQSQAVDTTPHHCPDDNFRVGGWEKKNKPSTLSQHGDHMQALHA